MALIDLNVFKSTPIKTYPSIEHKTFAKLGEKDSIVITPGLSSVLTADFEIKAKSDYDSA